VHARSLDCAVFGHCSWRRVEFGTPVQAVGVCQQTGTRLQQLSTDMFYLIALKPQAVVIDPEHPERGCIVARCLEREFKANLLRWLAHRYRVRVTICKHPKTY
jgi:hypothetical protein